jgi:hypothetical protein
LNVGSDILLSSCQNPIFKEMTLHEKLAAMEALWEDLARSPESIESPAWHEEVLDEHRQRFRQKGSI